MFLALTSPSHPLSGGGAWCLNPAVRSMPAGVLDLLYPGSLTYHYLLSRVSHVQRARYMLLPSRAAPPSSCVITRSFQKAFISQTPEETLPTLSFRVVRVQVCWPLILRQWEQLWVEVCQVLWTHSGVVANCYNTLCPKSQGLDQL